MLKKIDKWLLDWRLFIGVSILSIGLILLMSCNRQQSYGYWNGIYQPPPQEINDYEKP